MPQPQSPRPKSHSLQRSDILPPTMRPQLPDRQGAHSVLKHSRRLPTAHIQGPSHMATTLAKCLSCPWPLHPLLSAPNALLLPLSKQELLFNLQSPVQMSDLPWLAPPWLIRPSAEFCSPCSPQQTPWGEEILQMLCYGPLRVNQRSHIHWERCLGRKWSYTCRKSP